MRGGEGCMVETNKKKIERNERREEEEGEGGNVVEQGDFGEGENVSGKERKKGIYRGSVTQKR